MWFKFARKCALYYLASLALLVLGFCISQYKLFPYAIFEEFQVFFEGHDLESTTLADKLLNDSGIEPRRYLWKYPPNAIEHAETIEVPGLKDRRESPLVFVDDQYRTGYRAIFGAMDFQDHFWGGVLLDADGNAVHTWKLTTEHLPTRTTRDELSTLYGLHLFPDGSVIFHLQEGGGGIVKIDASSQVVWDLEGVFHHTISVTDDGYFWTFQGEQSDFDHKLAKISVETGKIEMVVDMADVRKQNPFVHIFDLQRHSLFDASHGNDIDPLSQELAANFPGFSAGDLLISYRSQNLLFVIDPETLEVKWWRIGAWDRQHDPDWEEDGTIAVFSNNLGSDRDFSDIISIDPATCSHRTLVDGETLNFYSDLNGLHQRTRFGTRMISSTTQGWAFELDQQNNIVFSFLNLYDKAEAESLNVSAALHLREQYFTEEFLKTCRN